MTTTSLNALIARVQKAALGLDRDQLRTAVTNLLEDMRTRGNAMDATAAKDLLKTMRGYRQFGAMQLLADGLVRLGRTEPIVLRQYAQALIDDGLLITARELLRGLLEQVALDPEELREARALMGRVNKQIFVETRGRQRQIALQALEEAITWYQAVYHGDSSKHWHGINCVALLCRARRDGIDVKDAPDPLALATTIRDAVAARASQGALEGWNYATAAEASLALDDITSAEKWVREYLSAPDTDAFAVAGTLRQFQEVWELKVDGTPAGELVAVLHAELLKREGGEVRLTPAQAVNTEGATEEVFERILGTDGPKTYRWLRSGLERARAVALIRHGEAGSIGTGFLVRGKDLHASLGEELLLLTNAHVVSEKRADDGVPPDEARAVFTIRAAERGGEQVHRVTLIWSSPRHKLDASLLRLTPAVEDIAPCPIAPRLPVLDEDQRVYIIGHPRGGELAFSLQDNELLDHEGPRSAEAVGPERRLIHYRAPTEPGSSGSPVFNQCSWEIIGLHHAGGKIMRKLNGKSGTYPANEAIWIQSIAMAIGSDLTPRS